MKFQRIGIFLFPRNGVGHSRDSEFEAVWQKQMDNVIEWVVSRIEEEIQVSCQESYWSEIKNSQSTTHPKRRLSLDFVMKYLPPLLMGEVSIFGFCNAYAAPLFAIS